MVLIARCFPLSKNHYRQSARCNEFSRVRRLAYLSPRVAEVRLFKTRDTFVAKALNVQKENHDSSTILFAKRPA